MFKLFKFQLKSNKIATEIVIVVKALSISLALKVGHIELLSMWPDKSDLLQIEELFICRKFTNGWQS